MKARADDARRAAQRLQTEKVRQLTAQSVNRATNGAVWL